MDVQYGTMDGGFGRVEGNNCHMYYTGVIGVMKMGIIVPRARLEPSSLTFRASVPPFFLDDTTVPCLSVYVTLCLRGQCRLLHPSPWNCKSFNAYNYIHTSNYLTYTYRGQVQQLYSLYLTQYHGHANQCHGCDENGKYCA